MKIEMKRTLIVILLILSLITIGSATYGVSGKIYLSKIFAGNYDNTFYFYVENFNDEKINVDIHVDKEYFIGKEINFSNDKSWATTFDQYKDQWDEVKWMKISDGVSTFTIGPKELLKVPITINTKNSSKGTYFASIETVQIPESTNSGEIVISVAYLSYVVGSVDSGINSSKGESSILQPQKTPMIGFITSLLIILLTSFLYKRREK